MKIFTEENSFKGRVNFVDENNVALGYDMARSCCETAGWLISDTVLSDPNSDVMAMPDFPDGFDSEGYNFDPKFYQTLDNNFMDGGGIVAFRIVDFHGNEKFLHIYNCHNGYYSHGFEFSGEDLLIEDSI